MPRIKREKKFPHCPFQEKPDCWITEVTNPLFYFTKTPGATKKIQLAMEFQITLEKLVFLNP